MKKIIGITGGSIGTDPMGLRTWSGSSRRFFSECEKEGLIERTIGLRMSMVYKYFNAITNYSADKEKWRKLFYSNKNYRDHMTNRLASILKNYDTNDSCLVQIGSEYNSAEAIRGKMRCISYNDGNYLISSMSPYFSKKIRTNKKNEAIKYEIDVCNSMDRVLTMSNFLRDSFIKEYGVDENKVICIGAGINIDYLPDKNIKKNYDNYEIVFIGVDFERKGGFFLLESFKYVREIIPGAKLNIIGPSRLNVSGCTEGVIFHGNMNRYLTRDARKFEDIMVRSSLFVMPSLYEPFGIAPLEAMAYRIPCVVSDGWALPEIVIKEQCGDLVPPGNAKALAEAMVRLLKDPCLLQKYGEYGRAHVEANFTWGSVVRRLKMVLDDL